MDVPEDRKFIGFDGYKKAMDCLKPGDVVILTTPLAFRWLHFQYAIDKNLNVFMEKPLTADGPCSRRMLDLAEKASAKNLKVGVGLMCRHTRHMEELADRIHGGEIGEIVLMRGYRVGATGRGLLLAASSQRIFRKSATRFRRFHSFIWASGGCYSDFNIHIIDHLCWMKNAWPIKAQALGGRHYRGDDVDQNFDSYSTEYTFGDGTKMLLEGRCMMNCRISTPVTRTAPKATRLFRSTAITARRRPARKSQRDGTREFDLEIKTHCGPDRPYPERVE